MIQSLVDALAERGYADLTSVQEAVARPELAGTDLLVSAQTGSGKTVAFGLALGPTLMDAEGRLGPTDAPLALIVAPTRELALQVMRELAWLYARTGARLATCVGGMDMREERRALERGAHIVVGTPGRLRDHVERGSLELRLIRAVVLDEADEMLDMGFREDLEFMLIRTPVERRTLMFSATVPPAIARLAAQFQRDALRIATVSATSQHADIAYQALRVAPTDAETAIVNVLLFHDAEGAIVFANTRAAVNRLSARFANRGFSVVTLSGELSQGARNQALQAMRDGRARVCVATDVAARGIDLPNLGLVIHAELPSNAEALLHRSGRTGRAGRKGTSALIVPPRLRRRAETLLREARIEAEWTTPPNVDEILRRDEERLLMAPVWEQETTEEEAAFAAKLLSRNGPEAIAAAYLRLYWARKSAPEELANPDAPGPAKERRPFGPSAWFALSVGRDRRAEPRWLLPLILRVGQLNKDAIGAIRVYPTETYVEIAENRVADFEHAIGDGAVLDEGISVRRAEGPPSVPRGRTGTASPTARGGAAETRVRSGIGGEAVSSSELLASEGQDEVLAARTEKPQSRRGRQALFEAREEDSVGLPDPAAGRGPARRKKEGASSRAGREPKVAGGRSGARQAGGLPKPRRAKGDETPAAAAAREVAQGKPRSRAARKAERSGRPRKS
jgi:ATP-dependent RNA helicase DeaD